MNLRRHISSNFARAQNKAAAFFLLFGAVYADYRTCFHEEPKYAISAAGAAAAQAYFIKLRSNPETRPYAELVCDSKKLAHADGIKTTMYKLSLDGKSRDWPAYAPTIDDARGNVLDLDTRTPVTENSDIDILRVRYLYDGTELYLHYELAARPDTASTNYWLHVYDSAGKLVYDFIFGTTSFVNSYQNGVFKESRVLTTGEEASFAASSGVEVWLNAKAFMLPESFYVYAASLSQSRKVANWSRKFEITAAAAATRGSAAIVLQYLASNSELPVAMNLPLAISLAESFVLAHSTPDIQMRILADALQMLEFGIANGIETRNQNFEALLAWSNRAFLWGGLSGFYFDAAGKINAEAYDFMFLNPAILPEVRDYLIRSGVPHSGEAPPAADAIDALALKLNRYRWKPEEVCRWAQEAPSRPDLAQLCADSRRDAANGGKVAQVNGHDIYIWAIMGVNFQWASIKNRGYYFGPCGDVAVVTMLGLKSLGIADLGLYRKYGLSDDLVHTFAVYYDSAAGKWKVPKTQLPPADQKITLPKPYLQWSLPPITEQLPAWQKKNFTDGAHFWVNERSPVSALAKAELRQNLENGIAQAVVRKMFLSSIKPHPQASPQDPGAQHTFSLSND